MIKDYIIKGKITAILSFVIGTMLFAFLCYFKNIESLFFAGAVFLILAFIVNITFVVLLLFSAMFYENYRIECIKTAGLMLLSIPVVLFYFYLIPILFK